MDSRKEIGSFLPSLVVESRRAFPVGMATFVLLREESATKTRQSLLPQAKILPRAFPSTVAALKLHLSSSHHSEIGICSLEGVRAR